MREIFLKVSDTLKIPVTRNNFFEAPFNKGLFIFSLDCEINIEDYLRDASSLAFEVYEDKELFAKVFYHRIEVKSCDYKEKTVEVEISFSVVNFIYIEKEDKLKFTVGDIITLALIDNSSLKEKLIENKDFTQQIQCIMDFGQQIECMIFFRETNVLPETTGSLSSCVARACNKN